MTERRRGDIPVNALIPDLPELGDLFIPCEPERVSLGGSAAMRIGRGGYKREFLLLDSGEVVQYRFGETKRFNSSLRAFRESIVAFRVALETRDAAETLDADLERQANALERQMRQIDPDAWATGTLWALMVEELGYGM